jgi:predicted small lipoprotein YifL
MKRIAQMMMVALVGISMLTSCGSKSPLGDKVKEPFSSNKYESSGRYYRAKGKGDSSDENIAKNKADLQAKKELAQQVETRMRVVTDQYLHENATTSGSEINDKFQSLIREVTNTTIVDLRKIGEEKYYEPTAKVYTVFMAYEIHKRDMYRTLKRQAKLNAKLTEAERKSIEEIIDEELKAVEALGEGE